MKLTIFAQMMAFVLTWALLVTALPSNAGGVSEISPRMDPASVLLGINCRGSSECGGYCHPNIGNIKYFVDQIDDKVEFGNGHMIACHACANCSDCPDNDKRGICVFPQGIDLGEKITAKVVKDSVNALIRHGCKRCGSNPVDPGNNVGDGAVTINFVRDICKTGLCDTGGEVSSGDLTEPKKSQASTTTNIALPAGSARAANEEGNLPILPAFSPRDTAPDSATTLLGINCRGSGRCSTTCGRNIFQLRDYVYQVGDSARFGNGYRIACVKCKGRDDGFCAYANSMKSGETIDGATVKDLMNALISHGCHGCGSVPIHPGNDISSGQLTVNFVYEACGDGVC